VLEIQHHELDWHEVLKVLRTIYGSVYNHSIQISPFNVFFTLLELIFLFYLIYFLITLKGTIF
jgi:hypothetical protein